MTFSVQTFFVVFVQSFFFAYFILANTVYLGMLIIAFRKIRDILRADAIVDFETLKNLKGLPGVSLLVPAFNEEATIVSTVHSLGKLNYPSLEIVIVDDGSTDSTAEKCIKEFNLIRREVSYQTSIETETVVETYESKEKLSTSVSRVVLLRKENGGKSDALNVGINAARTNYICIVDADSVMDRGAILRVMEPVLEDPEHVVASGGQVGIANGSIFEEGALKERRFSNNPLVLLQQVEYMQAFTIGRTARSALNALVVLSGAFSLIRVDVLREIGGFLTPKVRARVRSEYCGEEYTVGEDMEIILRIQRYLRDKGERGRVAYLPHPVTWTHVPEKLGVLARQRTRWFRGLTESLSFHRNMIFNPKYGRTGWIGLPYELIFEFFGGLVEIIGYLVFITLYILGLLNIYAFLFFLAISVGYGTVLSFIAVVLGLWPERVGDIETALLQRLRTVDIIKIMIASIFFHFGYRQLRLIWHWQGLFQYLRKKKSW
ncbi:glycosyltransferase family 2 protein [Bdellovibrionota bacterium]